MARGLVEIQGVTTRSNQREDRECAGCTNHIDAGVRYERVARLNGDIECFHVGCFEDEFGPRGAYGD